MAQRCRGSQYISLASDVCPGDCGHVGESGFLVQGVGGRTATVTEGVRYHSLEGTYINGLVQDCSISSVLAMEILQS